MLQLVCFSLERLIDLFACLLEMVLAAKLNAELKANKASMVTNHESSTDNACMYRERPFVSPKVGECARKGRGQMFHEKNYHQVGRQEIHF